MITINKQKELKQETGKRKKAIASVKMIKGSGKFLVNGKTIDQYFPSKEKKIIVLSPFKLTKTDNMFDVSVKVYGGGFSAQADSIKLGISKALCKVDYDQYHDILKNNGFLTRDQRIKERKKPGLKKARKAPQFSKR